MRQDDLNRLFIFTIKAGITIDPTCKIKEEDLNGKGPAHFKIYDPDNNPILFDQHV
jgi:hypothetical protein